MRTLGCFTHLPKSFRAGKVFALAACSLLFFSSCLFFPEEEAIEFDFSGATKAENISDSAIRLSWNASSSESVVGYNVYEISGGTSTLLAGIDSPATTTFEHTGLESGTAKTYSVQALDESGFEDGNVVQVKAITYPGITSATVSDTTGITVAFPAATAASSLRVYCHDGSGAYRALASPKATDTSATLTGLTAGLSYTCKVVAVLSGGTEDSNTLTASATLPDLSFLGATSASATSSASVTISWTAGTGASIAYYRVYEVSIADGSLTLIATVPASSTSYLHSGLSSGTLHTYLVRAMSSAGVLDANVAQVTTFLYTGISSATALSTTSATVSFASASEVSSLKIYCKTDSNAYSLMATPAVTATSTTLTGLTPGSTYTCKAQAVAATGAEYESATIVSFTLPLLTFAGATSASQVSSTSAQISWTAGSGSSIAKYKVYEVSAADGSLTLVATTTDASTTSYVHTGLTSGTLHTYVVRAVDSNGIDDGNNVQVTVFVYGGATALSAASTSSLTITYASASAASGLRIYCKAGSGSYSLLASPAVTSTSSTITGLTGGTAYTCKVQAVASNGTEYTNTSEVSATPPDLTFGGASSASQNSTTSILIAWTAGSGTGIASYKIYEVGSDDSLTLVASATSSTASYLHTGLTAGSYHRYIVRAFDSSGLSDGNTTQVKHLLYEGITSLTATGESTATANFPANSNAMSLKVWCKTPSGSYTHVATAVSTATSASLTGLTDGPTYTCKVQGVTGDGYESTSTVTASVYTDYAGATGSSSVSNTTATLTYSASVWASQFNLKCKDRTSSTYTQFGTGIAGSTSGSLTGLKSGMTYVCIAVPVRFGSEVDNSTTVTFQTTPYTQSYYNNVLIAKSYGNSTDAPSGPTTKRIAITWAPFDSADANTAYKVVRVTTGGSIATTTMDTATSCTDSTDTACLPCSEGATQTGASAITCTDANIAAVPKQYDYYIVLVIGGTPEEISSGSESTYKTWVPVTPDNMVLVHRDSVNAEMCNLMGKTTDPLQHNRCAYAGNYGRVPVNSGSSVFTENKSYDAGYYDMGYSFFIDRYEAGCNWTNSNTYNGGPAFGSGAPNNAYGSNGDVYFNTGGIDQANCYYKSGGSWSNAVSSSTAVQAMYTIAPRSGRNTGNYGALSPANANTVCNAVTPHASYGQKRLPRRREFVAAAAWPRLTGEPDALTWAQSAAIESTNTDPNCNYSGHGVTHTGVFNAGSQYAHTTTAYKGFVPASSRTTACVSRYGAQDVIGNFGELAIEDAITCNTTTLVCSWATPGSTLDSGSTDLDGFSFNGVQGPGGQNLYWGTALGGGGYSHAYVNPILALPLMDSAEAAANEMSNAAFTVLSTSDWFMIYNSSASPHPTIGGGYDRAGNSTGVGRFTTYMSQYTYWSAFGDGFRCVLPAE